MYNKISHSIELLSSKIDITSNVNHRNNLISSNMYICQIRVIVNNFIVKLVLYQVRFIATKFYIKSDLR